MKMAEAMKAEIACMLKGIDRYNPVNLNVLVRYLEVQVQENAYNVEANLTILKLYQFNPDCCKLPVIKLILLKALTNLPHSDFILCKCLIDQQFANPLPRNYHFDNDDIKHIMYLHDLLETCQFKLFWETIKIPEPPVNKIIKEITGFEDSIRKFICHVVNTAYQRIDKRTLCEFLGGITDYQLKSWMDKYGWKEVEGGLIFICNQEENIKTKNISENIEFDCVSAVMSLTRSVD